MGNLRTLFKLLSIFLISLVRVSNSTAANNTARLSNNDSVNNSARCLKVIPNHYEINIGPIRNSDFLVLALCLVKIKAAIFQDDCEFTNNDSNGPTIALNSRNCYMDLENITVSKIVTEQTQLLSSYVEHKWSNISDVPDQHILHLEEEQLNTGEQIVLHIPYEIDLNRNHPNESWEGLYYYDPSFANYTSLWNYLPLHARYMFPIIDNFDPFHRPTFKISVARYIPNGFVSVSNTDIVETVKSPELGEDWVTDHFCESPPMKMSQVTLFILGGFQNHTICNKNNTKYRATNIWTLQSGDFSNDTIYNTLFEAQSIMNYFDSVFNQTMYPLNKIDIIVVPWNIFDLPRATGNLGLVMTMPLSLSYSEGYSGEFQENGRTNLYIAGHIALQWFGGITSPNNEYTDYSLSGEALSFYVIKWVALYSYEDDPIFISGDSYVLDIAIVLNVIENVFSRKIIEYAISQIYLPKTVQNGTYPTNLWNAIQESIEFHDKTHLLPYANENGNVTVADVLNSWINKKYHYPTIRISDVENRTNKIEIYQVIPKGVDINSRGLWWVPVNISTENGSVLMWISPNNNSSNSSITYRNGDLIDTENGYLFVDPIYKIYYDVEYSNQLLKNAITQLSINHSVVPKDLIKKQFYLAKSDSTWNTMEMALETTKYLGKEMDRKIWEDAISSMSKFNGKFLQDPSSFQVYFGSKINKVLEKISLFPKLDDNVKVAELRRRLLEVSHLYEVPIFMNYSTNLMTKWMENVTVNPFYDKFDSGIRQAFYCSAVGRFSDNSAFNVLYERLVNHNLSMNFSERWTAEAKLICKALSCVKDDEFLMNLLRNDSKLAITEDKMLQWCYQHYTPLEILWRRPITMTKAVQEFWMKYDVQKYQEITNQTEEVNIMIPWLHDRKGFLDRIQFDNLRARVKFTPNFSLGMMSITWMPSKVEDTLDEMYRKSEQWFNENL